RMRMNQCESRGRATRRQRRRRRRAARAARAAVIMWYETQNQEELTSRQPPESAVPAAPVIAPLHPSVVLSQRCAAALRVYLDNANLAHYRSFFSGDHSLWDIDR